MSTITFEPVTDDSLTILAGILNYYVVNTTVTFHTKLLSAADIRSKVFFTQPVFRSFLVKKDGRIIGYCAISPWKQQEAYAHTGEINIYLAYDATGKGIGSQAINYLLSYAQEHDINNLIAGICSENKASIRLFEKSGFRQCGHFQKVGTKFGRILDTVYLQKILPAE